jgi:peptidylprolyl isomerase
MVEAFDKPFLEEVKLTEDGGIVKRIFEFGDALDPQPEKGQKVYAHYEGRLESNGKVFDSSYKRDEPFEFTIGVGQVIKGWDIGMMSMRIGEKAELVIQSDYGYGA